MLNMTSIPTNFTATFNANNLFDIRDLSYSLGSGIDFKFVKLSLFIEGRYSLGIVDVFKGGQGYFGDGGLVVFDGYKIKNKGLLILTGITFPFERKYKKY